ncbi:cytochrome P450 3A8-like isoform X2 [Amblyomma americanum]
MIVSAVADNFGLRELTFCALFLATLLYVKYLRRFKNYWKEQNVICEEFDLSWAPISKMLREPIQEIDMNRQKKYGKIFGGFEGLQPTLFISDPDLVKLVLVKHFQDLPDRRLVALNDPILDNMMTVVAAEQWRKIRPAASPAFSTGKLRKMNSIIQDCARITTQHLLKTAESGKDIHPKDFFGHYTLDVITRCTLGAKLGSHTPEADEFVAKSQTAFTVKPALTLVAFFYFWTLFPFISTLLRLQVFSPDTFLFLKNFCLNVIEKRKQSPAKHQDFLQLMIDAQDSGLQGPTEVPLNAEDKLYDLGMEQAAEKTVSTKVLSEEEALSQCVSFFIAGQDATSSALAYTFYLLAVNPDVQQRLREEVDECFKHYGEEPSLDDVSKLEYLNCVISESLRLYPPAVRVERTAFRDVILGDTEIKVSKGHAVVIPVYAMHRDPEYFPDPEKFHPERFSEENVDSIRPYSYLPFGAGPRNCIGMRFALQALKLCLLHVIHNVELVRTENTKLPLKMVTSFSLLTAEDITIGVKKRSL